MPLALVSLGSNLGDRRAILDAARNALDNSLGVSVHNVSAIHETAPVGGPSGQKSFLNAAALLQTTLPPAELLTRLQRIEWHLGRKREQRWAPRTLDLDLLLYDDLVLETRQLTLPHPRMAVRRFVLAPAVEIAPQMVHPLFGWTIQQLWEHLTTASPYAAIAGVDATSRSRLAGELVERLSARRISGLPLDCGTALQAADIETTQRALTANSGLRRESLVISDFWFEQLFVHASVFLPSDDHQFRRAWQAAAAGVVKPKVVLWLDASAEWLAEQDKHALPLEAYQGYRDALRDQLHQAHVGPWLRLDASNFEFSLEDSVAALCAMQ